MIEMIFAIVMYILAAFTNPTLYTNQSEFIFQSTSTMDMGVSGSSLASRRAIAYDDEDEYDYEDEEVVGPGYDPVDPATSIGGCVSTLLVFALIYVTVLCTKKNKST